MRKRRSFILTIIFVILSYNTVVKAISTSDLEQKRTELKYKINEAGKNLESVDIKLTESLEEINKIDEEIYSYEEQVEKISSNLQDIEKQIKKTETQLETIQERYDYRESLLKKRLVYWYEEGPTRYLDVLMNSKSIIDFISNYYIISEIAQYDQDLLDNIKNEKKQIEQIEQALKTSKENLKVVKAEQKKIAISLENAKVVKNSYINKLSDEEKKIQEDIEVYQNALDLVDLEILITALDGGSSAYVGGVFAWPAPGYYTITSPYGMRLHPVIKTYCNHSGMDIGAPTGAYAIAANDGVVTKATYSYSYGNMVMIDHGGGVTTLYAHGSEILVNVGDTVKRGDSIMKVGSTGWSTGPHLHFEIRIDGQTIDPYQYVTVSSR